MFSQLFTLQFCSFAFIAAAAASNSFQLTSSAKLTLRLPSTKCQTKLSNIKQSKDSDVPFVLFLLIVVFSLVPLSISDIHALYHSRTSIINGVHLYTVKLMQSQVTLADKGVFVVICVRGLC